MVFVYVDPLFFPGEKNQSLRPMIFGGNTVPENGAGLTTVEMHPLSFLLAFEEPLMCLCKVALNKTEFSVEVG